MKQASPIKPGELGENGPGSGMKRLGSSMRNSMQVKTASTLSLKDLKEDQSPKLGDS